MMYVCSTNVRESVMGRLGSGGGAGRSRSPIRFSGVSVI